MIINFASTLAYDENEVCLEIVAEKDEIIKIGDVITIPMIDHSFKQREITDMYRDFKNRKKGKELFSKITEGEWANCIIHNIHSEYIHTVNTPYIEEILVLEPGGIDHLESDRNSQFELNRNSQCTLTN